MLFAVFAHIQTDQCIFIIKHEFCQCFCQFCFSDSGWPDKNEGTDRALRVFEPGPRSADCIGNSVDGFILTNDAFMEIFLHMQQTFRFILKHLTYRYPGPLSNDLCDIIHIDHFIELLRGFPLGFHFFVSFLSTQTFCLQFGCFFVIPFVPCVFLIFHHLIQICFHFFQFRRKREKFDPQAGSGLIHEINRFIRQFAVCYVTGR